MAGIGSAWGSREEMLHPRDRHGRFRKKWKMAAGVVDALSGFLDRFSPRTFQSDQQASQYSFNHRKVPWTTEENRRLHMDWDEANESLQAGETDATTERFVSMMDRAMVPTEDDLIVSQTVPVEAFGLTPQQANLEDGGLEDFIGLEIADAGYANWNLGSELSHPPGSITIRTALPKGTRVAYGGRSPNDRSLFTDRDQPLVVTKVEPDGRGGYYMLAIAGSGKKTGTSVADDRTFGRRGAGLTPEQREARVSGSPMSGEERLRIAQQNEREMQTGPSTITPAPPAEGAPLAPAPVAPASPQAPAPPAAGVPERREPVQAEAIGPGSPEGRSATEVAQMGDEAKAVAEATARAEAAAPPAPPTPLEFQEAARDLSVPTAGKQRSEWNKAHRDLSQGKRDPGDVLRELDTDIEENKRKAAAAPAPEKKDALERNIQAQEQLADLISEKYSVPRRGTTAPVAKKAPVATPGAPSTKQEATPKAPAPKKATKRAPQEIADQFKTVKTAEEGNALLEGLTGPELHAVAEAAGITMPKRATKDKLKQAIGQHGFRRRLDGDAIRGQSTKDRQDSGRLTEEQEQRLVAKAGSLPDVPRNEEEERIKRLAAEIEARRTGTPAAPVKKAAPSEAAQARAAKKAAPPVPAKAVAAKKAVPAKAAPPPVDAEEEAFKVRVAEAGLPDKVADLRAQARDQKIRGFSTMNKRQLQSALLGDEVPKAGKIAPVTPAKLVPHIQAAKSDQEARGLLENHTLVDLKALAKERGVEVPKRGATKDRLKDDILADVRGVPEGAGGETPARSLRQELDAQKWVEPSDSAAATKVRGIIDDTDEMDAAELRGSRDDLEAYSKELRAGGNRQDANLVQTLADTMGMRAQTISGVEEGPTRAPVKRAVKKAVPAVPEGEAPPKTLDKMLKPELAQVAADEGVPGIRKSMTKPQLKEAIERHRRVQAARGDEPSVADRAPTPEEIARDTAPTAPPAKRAKARALKRVPEGSIAGPRTDQKLDSEPRKSSFREAWDGQGFQAEGAGGRSLEQVRDDVESGKITPEEGVRRLESEIAFNNEDIADLEAQVRGSTDTAERKELSDRIGQLRRTKGANTNASQFMRTHFKQEAPITRQELEVQLDAPEKAALDRVDVDSLKEAARVEGLGDIEGDDKDTVVQNIARKIAGRELANRELERKANERQARIDAVRGTSDNLAHLEQMAQNGGSDRALQTAIRRLPAEDQAKLSGDKETFWDELDDIIRSHGLSRVGEHGSTVPYDPAKHEVTGDAAPGSLVFITRVGHSLDLGDGDKVTFKAQAIPDTGTPTPAKKVTKKAAQAARNEEPLIEGAPPRKAGAPALTPGFEQTRVLRKLASTPTGEAPKTPEYGEEVDDAVRRAIAEAGGGATFKDLVEVRQLLGERYPREDVDNSLQRLSRAREVTLAPNSNQKILTEEDWSSGISLGNSVKHTASLEPSGKAKVSRATPKAAAPPAVVDLDQPKRHNAELIGTGIEGLDPKGEDRQWMDVVQRSLDRGEDGRQIADGLRREADSERTIHNIQEAVGAEATGPAARIDRMERYADRLEGVRPIAKPVGQRVTAEGRKDMGTMSGAQAQSRAFQDLKAGKSHAEVATALRQAATSVGSREYDPQMTRPVEFTPAERSAMKRSDAKKLRELATEIQAQGVAQRAAAKAAKKAAPKKARPSVADDAVATLLMDRIAERDPAVAKAVLAEISPEDRKELDAARARDTARKAAKKTAPANSHLRPDRGAAVLSENPEIRAQGMAAADASNARQKLTAPVAPPAPKKRTAAEMRRARSASESEGVPVDQVLERWDGQKQDRKNLTGPVGEMIAAQIEDAHQALLAADNPRAESEATGRLLHPELRTWATKLGLSPSGTKAVLEKRIADRIKGREAPGASAERAVSKVEAPSAGAGIDETVPLKPFPHDDNMRMHADSPTMGLAFAYEKAGRNGSANRMAQLRARATTPGTENRLTPQQVVDELKAIRAQETDPKFQQMLDRAIEANDAPMTPIPDLPPDLPASLRGLMEQLHAIPYARKGRGQSAAIGVISGPSLVDQLAEVFWDAYRGSRGERRAHPQDRIRDILRGKTHEMNEASFRIWEMTKLLESDEPLDVDAGRKVAQLVKELRDWERSHWPKQ